MDWIESFKCWLFIYSGGIQRDWVGYPRMLFKQGDSHPRCVCVHQKDLSNPHLKEYENCSPKAESCNLPPFSAKQELWSRHAMLDVFTVSGLDSFNQTFIYKFAQAKINLSFIGCSFKSKSGQRLSAFITRHWRRRCTSHLHVDLQCICVCVYLYETRRFLVKSTFGILTFKDRTTNRLIRRNIAVIHVSKKACNFVVHLFYVLLTCKNC